MLGGACDEQFLDVYRRPHDPPEGGSRGARLRDAGRRPWRCRARRRRRARWTVRGHRDQGRQAGDRLDERAPHDPLTVYVFSTPVLCAPSGALSFGLGQGAGVAVLRCGRRDTLGKNFRRRAQTAAAPIRQTGIPRARSCAALDPREAKRQSGATARPAAALGARDQARTSTRRAARPRLRPRASSGSRMLATVASAGGPPPSPVRQPGCAPRSALRAQQRRAARRAQARRARRRPSAPASPAASEQGLRPKSAPVLKLARTSPLKLARTSPPKLARTSPLKLARASPPKLARASPLKLARASPLKLARASPPKLARASLLKLARASLLKLARASPPKLARAPLLKLARASLLKLASASPPRSVPEPAPWPSPSSLLKLALLPLAISRLGLHRGLVVRSPPGQMRAAALP